MANPSVAISFNDQQPGLPAVRERNNDEVCARLIGRADRPIIARWLVLRCQRESDSISMLVPPRYHRRVKH